MDELQYFFGDVAAEVAKVSASLAGDATIADVTRVAESADDAAGWCRLRLPVPLLHPSGALVSVVPVLPAARRPRVRASDPAKLALGLGPINDAYRALGKQVTRWTQLLTIGVPDVIADNEQRVAATLLAQLCSVVRGASRAHWLHRVTEATVSLATTSIGPPRASDPARSGAAVDRLVWIDDRRFAIQRRGALAIFEMRRKRLQLVQRAKTHAASLAYLYEGGLVCSGVPWPDDNEYVAGVHVFDLATGAWRDAIPREPRLVVFSQDQPESANLYDAQTRQELVIEGVESDRPEVAAWTRDGQFVWISDDEGGPIVGAMEGDTYVDTSALVTHDGEVPVLGRDGVVARRGRGKRKNRASAIALLADRRWRVLAADGAFEGAVHRFSLGFAPRAAAFDASGERVALLLPDAVWIVRWDGPRVLARLPLP